METFCFQKPENVFLKRITLFVFLMHGGLLFFLGFQQKAKPLKNKPNKIAVRLVQLEPAMSVGAPSLETVTFVPEKKVETVKKVEPVKKAVPKKEMKPALKKEVKPVVKKEEVKTVLDNKTKQKELLAAARSNLAKANVSALKKASPKAAPIGPLSFEGSKDVAAWEMGYRDELAARLKTLLKLPEKGEVKIKLTLKRSGDVLKLIIDSFESKKNKEYIEKVVKDLHFPSFQGDFNEFSEYTFSITLKG